MFKLTTFSIEKYSHDSNPRSSAILLADSGGGSMTVKLDEETSRGLWADIECFVAKRVAEIHHAPSLFTPSALLEAPREEPIEEADFDEIPL